MARALQPFSLDDPATIKRLIRENPWATLVSTISAGLVASHYPVLLDERREEISILSHVGRPDDQLRELGALDQAYDERARARLRALAEQLTGVARRPS